MRWRFVAFAAAAFGVCLLSIPRPTASVEPQDTAAQIDFDSLHAQAAIALETLQYARERRIASVEDTSF